MRLYFLIITLFLATLNLVAQQANAIKLSPNQLNLIQTQGKEGIQSVFDELGIQIENLQLVEDFTSAASAELISVTTDTETISKLASDFVYAFAEMSSMSEIDDSYIIEYVSAGLSIGLVYTCQNTSDNALQKIKAISQGSALGAIKYAQNSARDIERIASAVSSGSLAGVIESANDLNLDIVESVKFSVEGLVYGTLSASTKLDAMIYETIRASAEGIAEAAIEASVKISVALLPQITASSVGAGKSAVESAYSLDLSIQKTLKAITLGLNIGANRSIPGKGNNIRIFIAPIKKEDVDIKTVLIAIDKGIEAGSKLAGFINILPMIQTPFDGDSTIRVSPTN